MTPREAQFQQQYSTLIRGFEISFPGIKPPDPSWFNIWLRDYNFQAVCDAMQTLAEHPLKARFTTESTGKAISALLREAALRRAISRPIAVQRSAPAMGGVK